MDLYMAVSNIVWFVSLGIVTAAMAFCAIWALVTKTKAWIVAGIVAGIIGINANVVVQFFVIFFEFAPAVERGMETVVPFLSMASITYFIAFILKLNGPKAHRSVRRALLSIMSVVFVVSAAAVFAAYDKASYPIWINVAFSVNLTIELYFLFVVYRLKTTQQDNWEVRELKVFLKRLFLPTLLFVPFALFEIFLSEVKPYPLGHRFTTGAMICAVLGLLFVRFFYHWVTFHVNGLTASVMNRGSETAQSNLFGLTERELELVELLSQGLSNSAMAEKLFISPSTVKNHLYNIYQKTGAKNRIEILKLYKHV